MSGFAVVLVLLGLAVPLSLEAGVLTEIGPVLVDDQDQLSGMAQIRDDLFLIAYVEGDDSSMRLFRRTFEAAAGGLSSNVEVDEQGRIDHVDVTPVPLHQGALCPWSAPSPPRSPLSAPGVLPNTVDQYPLSDHGESQRQPPALSSSRALLGWSAGDRVSWLLVDDSSQIRIFRERLEGAYPSAAYGKFLVQAASQEKRQGEGPFWAGPDLGVIGCWSEKILLTYAVNQTNRSFLKGQFLSVDGELLGSPFDITSVTTTDSPGLGSQRLSLGKSETLFDSRRNRWLVIYEIRGPGGGDITPPGELKMKVVDPTGEVGEDICIGGCEGGACQFQESPRWWRLLDRLLFLSAQAYSEGYCHPFSVAFNPDSEFNPSEDLLINHYQGLLTVNYDEGEKEPVEGEGDVAGGEHNVVVAAQILHETGRGAMKIPYVRFRHGIGGSGSAGWLQFIDGSGILRSSVSFPPSGSVPEGFPANYRFLSAAAGKNWLVVLATGDGRLFIGKKQVGGELSLPSLPRFEGATELPRIPPIQQDSGD